MANLIIIRISFLLLLLLNPIHSKAWIIKNGMTTARYMCGSYFTVELQVDMNKQIGVGDAAPIRPAVIIYNGQNYPAQWFVGGDNNSTQTNDGKFRLVFWHYISLTGPNGTEACHDE